MYRKKNSTIPRTVYVQPMRSENQVSVVVPSCSGCTGREVDVIGNRQQYADMASRGQAVSEAVFLGNRMSPPAIPLRVGGVRTSHDQTYYSQRVISDMAQPRPRINGGYHGNRLNNPQISRSTSDGVHQQLVYASPSSMTNVAQKHATVTSSSQRDVIRHPVESQPLDKLQHFVVGQQIPPGQQSLDVRDLRRRLLSSPHSPRLLTSGPLNNVDGRIHAPGVGGDYSLQDPAAAPLLHDCAAIPEAECARRGAGFSSYQAITGHSPRFATGATYSAPGPPPSLRRHPNPLQPPQLLHGLPHSGTGGPAAAPLDMSGAKHGRYSSLNQVSAEKLIN